MGRIKPLKLCQPLPVKHLSNGFKKTKLWTEHILQPHGCQCHGTHHVRHVNNGPEGALKADTAGQNSRKEKRKPHNNNPAKEPDAENVPHGYAEQLRVE